MSLIKAVQRAFSKMAPVSLAESWDNTGLLLESPILRPNANKVLLTIDLTPKVFDEALKEDSNIGVIVSYHPIIFRGLKSLRLDDPLQKIILKCATSGISIYSPHTALDSVIGGINDELCKIISSSKSYNKIKIYSISGGDQMIEKIDENKLRGKGYGGGRRIEFEKGEEIEIDQLINRIKIGLKLSHVQLAKSMFAPPKIRSVGVCAGSGGSICEALGKSCDAFLTGEMSHHELLSANARGVHVILTAHTNTERFFLANVLQERLHELLADEAAEMSANSPPKWEVEVSKEDHDPLVVV